MEMEKVFLELVTAIPQLVVLLFWNLELRKTNKALIEENKALYGEIIDHLKAGSEKKAR